MGGNPMGHPLGGTGHPAQIAGAGTACRKGVTVASCTGVNCASDWLCQQGALGRVPQMKLFYHLPSPSAPRLSQ